MEESKVVLTSSALLEFLLNVEELSGKDIGVDETESQIVVKIGDSAYEINTSDAIEVAVEDEVVETVDEVDDQAYQNLLDSDQVEDGEAIESGILKEIGKSLLLGGMIRLSSKLLK